MLSLRNTLPEMGEQMGDVSGRSTLLATVPDERGVQVSKDPSTDEGTPSVEEDDDRDEARDPRRPRLARAQFQ